MFNSKTDYYYYAVPATCVATATMNCALRFISIIPQTFYVHRKQEFLQHPHSATTRTLQKAVFGSERETNRLGNCEIVQQTHFCCCCRHRCRCCGIVKHTKCIKWVYLLRSRSFLRRNKMPGIKLCVHLH